MYIGGHYLIKKGGTVSKVYQLHKGDLTAFSVQCVYCKRKHCKEGVQLC